MLVFSIFHSYVSLPEGKHTEAPQLKRPTAPLHQEQSLEAKTQEPWGLCFLMWWFTKNTISLQLGMAGLYHAPPIHAHIHIYIYRLYIIVYPIYSKKTVTKSIICIPVFFNHPYIHDTTRHDTARHNTTRHGTTRHDTARHGNGTARQDTTRHDIA